MPPPSVFWAAWAAWERYGITDYTVLERDGLRIGVFGVLGVDADECAPMSGMEFTPIAGAAREVVAQLQQEDVDYIICLSHSGTDDGKGEDYELAKAVPGIDVILSGHTHSTTEAPIQVNKTLIVSCGEYTQNLGVLKVEKSSGTVQAADFRLLPINETVAEDYYWQELPFVYRTHEVPDEEKIRALATFINNFGYFMHVGVNEIRPKEIQKLLAKVENTPEEALICRLALRSMKQARYMPENIGHFGLAANYYTHFTSPIRRYPDLQIHRIIKDNLRGRMDEKKIEHYRGILQEVTKHSSEMERRADEAERETVKLKKAEYMQRHIGEEFDGVISGMTKWGMYVELPNTVEGLVHVTNMTDDHYDYYEDRYEMVGSHTRRSYKLGQQIRVRVLGVDRLMRTIDFEAVGNAPGRGQTDGEDEWQDDCEQ